MTALLLVLVTKVVALRARGGIPGAWTIRWLVEIVPHWALEDEASACEVRKQGKEGVAHGEKGGVARRLLGQEEGATRRWVSKPQNGSYLPRTHSKIGTSCSRPC